jgi:hypothetical protein
MNEQWLLWNENLAGKYNITSITYTLDGGFKIELEQCKNCKVKIKLFFERGVYAYRFADEILMSNLITQLVEKYGINSVKDRTFYTVDNSEYLSWLSSKSGGLADYRSLQHFAFICSDSTLDVIANYEPTIEVIEEK